MSGNQANQGELVVPSSVARLNYFFGQLLTQRDLQAEQRFHLLLQRLGQREVLGTGTVAGLAVEHAPGAGERCVFLRPGLALDPDGRELLVPGDVRLQVADEALVAGQAGLTAADFATLAKQLADRWHAPMDEAEMAALAGDLKAVGVSASAEPAAARAVLDVLVPPSAFVLAAGMTLREHLFAARVGTSYVGLRYHERGAEPSPALLDASCGGEAACFPARVEECVAVVVSSAPLPAIADPYADALTALRAAFGAEDRAPPPSGAPYAHDVRRALANYLLGAWRGLPAVSEPCGGSERPAVPLAAVRWDRFARVGGVRILSVDNVGARLLAPGGPVIRALLEAITQSVSPGPQLPRLVAVEPGDHRELVVAAGAVSAEVVAVSELPLGTPPSARWELDLHRAGGTEVERYDVARPPTNLFTVALAVEPDAAGRVNRVVLRFKALGGQPLRMPAGTYVWRINLAGGELAAQTTGALLDGEPAPVRTLPSGDGRPGGTFSARFFVR